jgi:hypothetical protein
MASTQGVEIMRRLNDGSLEQAPSEYLSRAREQVSAAIEELVDVGARIRPLLVGDRRIGWVRGVHPSERKMLKRWIFDEVEFIEQLLLLGTTLTLDEIQALSMIEMRSLSRVVRAMTDSDIRLYPYISAFVTTSVSEQLWFSKGVEATAFRERVVTLPDGKTMRIIAQKFSSPIFRFWSRGWVLNLCAVDAALKRRNVMDYRAAAEEIQHT